MTRVRNGRRVPETPDGLIAALASKRYGVFSRAQVLERGVTDDMVRRRLAAARWERLYPGVYRLAGVPQSWRQALLALCLAWGAASFASHRAAAAHWELLGFGSGAMDLIVPRGRHRMLPGTIHRPVRFPSADATVLAGIPVTTPARTLLDIAGQAPPESVEEAVDDALRRRLVSVSKLRWQLRESARSGRPGVVLLRSLVEARTTSSASPQSVFETRLHRAIRSAGLPNPKVQHQIRDRRTLVAIVDLAFPDHKVAIEAEGYRWHSGRLKWEHDLARRNAITARGWRLIHVTWADLHERKDETVAAIARAIRP